MKWTPQTRFANHSEFLSLNILAAPEPPSTLTTCETHIRLVAAEIPHILGCKIGYIYVRINGKTTLCTLKPGRDRTYVRTSETHTEHSRSLTRNRSGNVDIATPGSIAEFSLKAENAQSETRTERQSFSTEIHSVLEFTADHSPAWIIKAVTSTQLLHQRFDIPASFIMDTTLTGDADASRELWLPRVELNAAKLGMAVLDATTLAPVPLAVKLIVLASLLAQGKCSPVETLVEFRRDARQ